MKSSDQHRFGRIGCNSGLRASTRAHTLDAAFAANPARFKAKRPTPKLLPAAVWINPPAVTTADPQEPPEQH